MEEYQTIQLVVCLFFSGVEQLLCIYFLYVFFLSHARTSLLKIDTIKLLCCLINHQINVGTKEVTISRKYS
jgi:hypothetical protein